MFHSGCGVHSVNICTPNILLGIVAWIFKCGLIRSAHILPLFCEIVARLGCCFRKKITFIPPTTLFLNLNPRTIPISVSVGNSRSYFRVALGDVSALQYFFEAYPFWPCLGCPKFCPLVVTVCSQSFHTHLLIDTFICQND